jgi:putative pyruvate formate lyase activating enzyme
MSSIELMALYENCRICPRGCGVNRLKGETGFCGETADLRIASASLHFGEEPPVTGKNGSGTIFVTGCNLHCAFCQNFQISFDGVGRAVTSEEFASICLALEKEGAENINIVTGSHAVPAIILALEEARRQRMTLPVLWNSSGYDSVESLKLLAPYITTFMPDLKTLSSATAQKYFSCADYPQKSLAALEYLFNCKNNIQKENIILRHLVMPGNLEDTAEILKWYADNAKDKATLSLMTQYTPLKNKHSTDTPSRFVDEVEYEAMLQYIEDYEIDDGYYQELEPDNSWLPDFENPNPFPSTLSKTIWSYLKPGGLRL